MQKKKIRPEKCLISFFSEQGISNKIFKYFESYQSLGSGGKVVIKIEAEFNQDMIYLQTRYYINSLNICKVI